MIAPIYMSLVGGMIVFMVVGALLKAIDESKGFEVREGHRRAMARVRYHLSVGQVFGVRHKRKEFEAWVEGGEGRVESVPLYRGYGDRSRQSPGTAPLLLEKV